MSVLQNLAGKLPLSLYQTVVKRDVVGIFYHMVSEKAVPHTRHLYHARPARLFEEDLVYLKTKFTPVSFDTLLEARQSGKSLPEKAIHISFDDGYAECFSIARPLLLKHGIPCTFFVTADFIDNKSLFYRNKASLCLEELHLCDNFRLHELMDNINQKYALNLETKQACVQWIKSLHEVEQIDYLCALLGLDTAKYLTRNTPYLTATQIQVMVSEGFSIGGHGKSHRKLGRLSSEEIKDEIIGSCAVIKELTGQEHVPFSFPNSGQGIDRRLLVDLLRDNPFIGLFFDTKGLYSNSPNSVNRIWVEATKYNATGVMSLEIVLLKAYQSHISEVLRIKHKSIKRIEMLEGD